MTVDAPERPPSGFERVDRAVYGVERGVITGSLLVMTFTYFLSIVHREMTAHVNAFDRLFLRWRGYDSTQGVPQAVLDTVTGVQTPLVLGMLGVVMAMLAFRTRDRVALEQGAAPTSTSWPRRLMWSLLATLIVYGLLRLVAAVPAQWMCLGLLFVLIFKPLRDALTKRSVGPAVGFVLGAALLTWFFVTRVEGDYIFAGELANLLLMYVGFFGASMATRDGKHITIDALRQRMSPRLLPLYNAIGAAVTVVFCAVLLALAIIYMRSSVELGHVHKASHLPKVLDVLPIVLALGLMMVRFAVLAARDLRAFARGELAERTAPELH